jgi:hypothetical protein
VFPWLPSVTRPTPFGAPWLCGPASRRGCQCRKEPALRCTPRLGLPARAHDHTGALSRKWASCGDIGSFWAFPLDSRALHARPTRAPAALLPRAGSEGQVSQRPALPVTASSLGELANASREPVDRSAAPPGGYLGNRVIPTRAEEGPPRRGRPGTWRRSSGACRSRSRRARRRDRDAAGALGADRGTVVAAAMAAMRSRQPG